MNRVVLRACALVLALLPLLAVAQALPRPAEFYFDEDEAVARPIVAIEGSGDAVIAQLLQQVERGRRGADRAAAQLAHISMAGGRIDTGKTLYARAAEAASSNQTRLSIAWNLGWDLHRTGDTEGALAQWALAVNNRGAVRPAWVPPTLALALWKLDRKPEAIAWYAAAVRTYPDRWPYEASLPGLLPDWSDADRATLAEVLAAWRTSPPAWP